MIKGLTFEAGMEKIDRLDEIKDEFKELLREAHRLIREAGSEHILARAEAYWLAHIKMAIDKDHDYLGGSMCSMDDTIREIESHLDQRDGE